MPQRAIRPPTPAASARRASPLPRSRTPPAMHPVMSSRSSRSHRGRCAGRRPQTYVEAVIAGVVVEIFNNTSRDAYRRGPAPDDDRTRRNATTLMDDASGEQHRRPASCHSRIGPKGTARRRQLRDRGAAWNPLAHGRSPKPSSRRSFQAERQCAGRLRRAVATTRKQQPGQAHRTRGMALSCGRTACTSYDGSLFGKTSRPSSLP